MSYIPYQDIDFIDKLLQEKPVQENSRKLAFSLNS
jgi:hypothetical protein